MSEKEFVAGLFAKAPHERAPDFVKASLSIKRADLGNWLRGKSDEWINIDINPGVNPDIVYDLQAGLPYWKWGEPADLIFASHLMEHIDPAKSFLLMDTCFEALKPGGHFIAVTPHAFSDDGPTGPHHVAGGQISGH